MFDARKNLCCHDVAQMPRSPRLFAPIGTRQGVCECVRCGGVREIVSISVCAKCAHIINEAAPKPVAPVQAPAPVAQPKLRFRVGDKVRCLHHCGFSALHTGQEYEISADDGEYYGFVGVDNGYAGWKSIPLELLSPPPLDVSGIAEANHGLKVGEYVEMLPFEDLSDWHRFAKFQTGMRGTISDFLDADGSAYFAEPNITYRWPVKSLRKIGGSK